MKKRDMHKICFCPKSIQWILRNLKKSSISKFRDMLHPGFGLIATDFSKKLRKKRRTAKQRAATRRLIAFNKRRRN